MFQTLKGSVLVYLGLIAMIVTVVFLIVKLDQANHPENHRNEGDPAQNEPIAQPMTFNR